MPRRVCSRQIWHQRRGWFTGVVEQQAARTADGLGLASKCHHYGLALDPALRLCCRRGDLNLLSQLLYFPLQRFQPCKHGIGIGWLPHVQDSGS